jgi:hypothetical protein
MIWKHSAKCNIDGEDNKQINHWGQMSLGFVQMWMFR